MVKYAYQNEKNYLKIIIVAFRQVYLLSEKNYLKKSLDKFTIFKDKKIRGISYSYFYKKMKFINKPYQAEGNFYSVALKKKIPAYFLSFDSVFQSNFGRSNLVFFKNTHLYSLRQTFLNKKFFYFRKKKKKAIRVIGNNIKFKLKKNYLKYLLFLNKKFYLVYKNFVKPKVLTSSLLSSKLKVNLDDFISKKLEYRSKRFKNLSYKKDLKIVISYSKHRVLNFFKKVVIS